MTEEIKGAAYAAKPNLDRYFERTIEIQRQKIESQTQELARMNRVYMRNVRTSKVSDAIKFLIQVIIEKIKI